MQKVWHWLVGFIIQVYVIHITIRKGQSRGGYGSIYLYIFNILHKMLLCYHVNYEKSIYCWLVINSQITKKKMQISTTKKPIKSK